MWTGRRRFLKLTEFETRVTFLKNTLERLELGFNVSSITFISRIFFTSNLLSQQREMLVTTAVVAEETKAENAANAASIREQIDAGFEAANAQQAAFMADIRSWQASVDTRLDGISRAGSLI